MAFDNAGGSVAVGDTATLIVEGAGNGVNVAVSNVSEDTTVYLGGGDVTDVDGFPLAAGEQVGFTADDGDDLYGVTDSGTADVRVLRQGV